MFERAIRLLVAIITVTPSLGRAEPSTAEDSVQAGTAAAGSTLISGYGNARYQHDVKGRTSVIDLERFVLFVGHRFDSRISLSSELEIEDAKVEGGAQGGEIALEQAYLKFDLDPHMYIVAGLFLPRIGILNERHLPPDFNGNERTIVETLVIPATWRELGVGLYGALEGGQLQYSFALVNGLSSAGFEHGSLIREGRFEGRNASANNLALNGALRLYQGNFRVQVSGYVGGTVGLSGGEADSLHLASGAFGTPVIIGEADCSYQSGGLSVTTLGTVVSIPDAQAINHAYANNTPELAYGAYVEIAYDLFAGLPWLQPGQLIAFARWERLDLNSRIPANGIADGTLDQNHLVTGLTCLPTPNIVLKADVRFTRTGQPNPALRSLPNQGTAPYYANDSFINLGIGFAF